MLFPHHLCAPAVPSVRVTAPAEAEFVANVPSPVKEETPAPVTLMTPEVQVTPEPHSRTPKDDDVAYGASMMTLAPEIFGVRARKLASATGAVALMFNDARDDPPLTDVAVPPVLEPQVGQESAVPSVEGVATIGEVPVTLAPIYVPRSTAVGAIRLPTGCHM